MKYRDSGELEWAARYDGARPFVDGGSSVAVDAVGNVLVTGEAGNGFTDLDFGVLKYDPSGGLLWTYFYDGPDHSVDRGAAMRVDAAGNIYLAGNSADGGYRFNATTVKLDAGGNVLWSAREGSLYYTGVFAKDMDLDAAGNVATVATDGANVVTWNYNAEGQRRWIARHRAEDPAPIHATHIRFDSSGNALLAASLYGSGINDTILVKYAPDGRQHWAARVADARGVYHAHALELDAAGNAYLTATPGSDSVTVKVGADGSQLWSATYKAGDSFHDAGMFLKVNTAGDVFVATRSSAVSQVFVSLAKFTQHPVPGLTLANVVPALQIVDPGANVIFTAEGTGTGPLQWQWRRNGRDLDDATNATLALENVQVEDRADYSVVVSGPAGTTVSADARLTVRVSAAVTISPTNDVGYVGMNAGFVATVVGNDFATLQWRHNGTNIPGATGELLYLDDLSAASGGWYDVVASTVGGTNTSPAAGLRISREVRLAGKTTHPGYFGSWDHHPLMRVLPDGTTVIACIFNHPVRGLSIMVRKQNGSGELTWAKTFESDEFTNAQPSALELDAAGNIYVAGVSLQPYIPVASALLKYSADGQLQWSRLQTGTNQNGAFISSLAVSPNGDSTLGTLSFTGTTLVRRSNAGDVLWSSHDPSNNDDTLAVVADAAGNSYVGTTPRDTYQARIRKIDAAGATTWTRSITNSPFDRLSALAIDAAGNLIAVGTSSLPEIPDSAMFIVKYAHDGERLWLTRAGGEEVRTILDMKIGPGGEVTVLTLSDDDFYPEQSGLTRIGADGEVRFRAAQTDILAYGQSRLALDDFGNTYVTGSGGRAATGADVVTAKYDSTGRRVWLVYYGATNQNWETAVTLGVDAGGDVHVLGSSASQGDGSVELVLLHYQQRDPRSAFQLQLVRDADGTFHLTTPTKEPYRIEASTDLRDWTVLDADKTTRLFSPALRNFRPASSFSSA